MKGGRALGLVVLVATVLLIIASVQYNNKLEQQRTQAVAQLVSMPEYQNCKYDASTCPQAEGNVAIPNPTAIGLVILGLLVGFYLVRSDMTQHKILEELGEKRKQLSASERRELVLSVLTDDEQRIVKAVIEQPGISQATLRLRTDMSKAKLSVTLKDLEGRGIIKKIEDGKTNAVHLKREL